MSEQEAAKNNANAAVPATDQHAPQDQGRGSVGGVPTLTVNTRVQNQGATGAVGGTPVEQAPAGPPPGIIDVNSIEWQSLDTQGQIQGECSSYLVLLEASLAYHRSIPVIHDAEVV